MHKGAGVCRRMCGGRIGIVPNAQHTKCISLQTCVKYTNVYCVYNIHFIPLWKILKDYGNNSITEEKKNIDLPIETLQKLSIMAASQGKSVKAFIEYILVSKADTLKIEVSNPSPSNDAYFANPANLAEVEERVKEHKEGKTKATVVLHTAEDITNFINSL